MSTTQVVFLQKRVAALAQLVERQQAVIHALSDDIDYTESVGCAFAFDLARYMDGYGENIRSEVVDAMSAWWDEAMKHAKHVEVPR